MTARHRPRPTQVSDLPFAGHLGPMPKYVQRREILRDLASNELLPDSLMASERELA